MNKIIFLASDHGGFSLKETIKKYLINNKIKIEDLGCSSLDAVDYPDYAKLLASKIENNNN